MILVFLGLYGAWCVYMLIRNERVYHFRMWLLENTSIAAQRDIIHNRDWRWRYEDLHSVSYKTMLYHFWRPLRVEDWFSDLSFLGVEYEKEEEKSQSQVS